jgi:hypothetical protein
MRLLKIFERNILRNILLKSYDSFHFITFNSKIPDFRKFIIQLKNIIYLQSASSNQFILNNENVIISGKMNVCTEEKYLQSIFLHFERNSNDLFSENVSHTFNIEKL